MLRWSVNEDLANFTGLLAADEIDALVRNPKLNVLQFCEPVDPRNWPLLEEGLFSRRPEVALRVYGHTRGETCHLSFVRDVPSVRKFHAGRLLRVASIEAIADLPHLRELWVDIPELESFEFLQRVSDKIETLFLAATRSTRPSLDVITRFTKLRELLIEGHTKGLHCIGRFPQLEKLRLRRLKSPDLEFLATLPRLWWLEFRFGGSNDLSAIAGAKHLKHLELCWIRRLADISFISRCESLQRLILGRLKQVRKLPDFTPLRNLRALTITTMHNLESVDPIRDATALEWFGGSNPSQLRPEDFRQALQAPLLQRASIYFKSRKREQEFDQLAAEYGINTKIEHGCEPFEFRS